MQYKMKILPERERLINAAHRFAKISEHDPMKVFSLLYMLDVRLYREVGKICTGEVYYAMADGPAPGSLRSLLVMRDLDIHSAIGVLTSTESLGPWRFDPKQYCQNALEIMHELESAYRYAASGDIILDDDNAWWRVYTKSRGVGAVIPFELTMEGTHFGSVTENTVGSKTYVKSFSSNNTYLTSYLCFGKQR